MQSFARFFCKEPSPREQLQVEGCVWDLITNISFLYQWKIMVKIWEKIMAYFFCNIDLKFLPAFLYGRTFRFWITSRGHVCLNANYQYKLSILMVVYGQNLGKNNGVLFLQYQCKVLPAFFVRNHLRKNSFKWKDAFET